MAEPKNKVLYEHMQQNNTTKHMMEDLLHMHCNPLFCFGMIAKSVHVLSEAGQVHFMLYYLFLLFLSFSVIDLCADDVPTSCMALGLCWLGDA
jgi:hypothetical protein